MTGNIEKGRLRELSWANKHDTRELVNDDGTRCDPHRHAKWLQDHDGLVALSPGEALARLLGLLLLDLTLLLIGAETAGGVMTKLIVRNNTVLGASNSDVHAKLPFLLESFLADVL